MELAILFIAPIAQTVLSTMRVLGKVRISLGGIAVLAFVVGYIASFKAMDIVLKQLDAVGQRCGMPAMAILLLGLFGTLITTLLIWGISYILYIIKQKKSRPV